MKKINLVVIWVCLLPLSIQAQKQFVLTSPNGQIITTVSIDHKLTYSVTCNGETVVDVSPLSLTLSTDEGWAVNLQADLMQVVKGFKVDFMDRDDQEMVEFVYRAADVCAKYHIILDLHGMYKPAGLNRTYPNVLNVEGVFGLEQMKWSSASIDQV
ncbi:Retaining alpha-galactosidase, partial [termite gut metagenome]